MLGISVADRRSPYERFDVPVISLDAKRSIFSICSSSSSNNRYQIETQYSKRGFTSELERY